MIRVLPADNDTTRAVPRDPSLRRLVATADTEAKVEVGAEAVAEIAGRRVSLH
jgi:hypothetical protein